MANKVHLTATGLITFCLILLTSIPSHKISAQSELEIRAEAQFEFYKIFNDLEKRINEKNPQTFDELKQIAKDYFFERADHLKNLNPGVKVELCNMLSDTQNILLGSPYPSGLCELFASPKQTPTTPLEECKYVEGKSSGTTMHKTQVGSSLIIDAELSKDLVVLGNNQTVRVHVKSSISNGPEPNANVQLTMSDSSGKAIHSTSGKTDVNGSFSYSWNVDSESKNRFYSVTVMVKDPVNLNWSGGTLYFNRTPDLVRICSYVDPEGKFTLEHPDDWFAVPKENTDPILDLILSNRPSGSGVVTLSFLDTGSSNYSVEDLIAIDMNQAPGRDDNFRLSMSPTCVKYNISGYKTGAFSYTYEHSEEHREEIKLVTKVDNQFLILIYYANQNDFLRYLPLVEDMFRSIQLKN